MSLYTCMKCEAVEELMEGSDGNGFVSLHQNYMDSLQYDSPVGSISVALPDFSAVFDAFERSFLAIDEDNEIEIHGALLFCMFAAGPPTLFSYLETHS